MSVGFLNNPIAWREFIRMRRQWSRIVGSVFQIITVSCISVFAGYVSTDVYSLFIFPPLLFTFYSANDIFFNDLGNSIETLLSTPLNPYDIIRKKSSVIVIRSYVFSLLAGVITLCLGASLKRRFIFEPDAWAIGIVLALIFWQPTVCRCLGTVAWSKGRKSRYWLVLLEFIGVLSLHALEKRQEEILVLVILATSYFPLNVLASGKILVINKERLVERSIKL